MSNSFSTDQISKAFLFILEDEEGLVKLLIAAALLLANFIIPLIPMIFLLGYSVVIMEGIIRDGRDPFLPEWNDWSGLFIKGLRVFGLNILPAIPIFLLLNLTIGVFFAILALSIHVPADSPLSGLTVVFSAGSTFLTIVFILFFSVFGIIWSIIYPAILGYAVQEDRFGALLSVREWWSVFKADPGSFLLAYFLVLIPNSLVAMISSFAVATFVLICILPFILVLIQPYIIIVSNTLYAQAYHNAVKNLYSEN